MEDLNQLQSQMIKLQKKIRYLVEETQIKDLERRIFNSQQQIIKMNGRLENNKTEQNSLQQQLGEDREKLRELNRKIETLPAKTKTTMQSSQNELKSGQETFEDVLIAKLLVFHANERLSKMEKEVIEIENELITEQKLVDKWQEEVRILKRNEEIEKRQEEVLQLKRELAFKLEQIEETLQYDQKKSQVLNALKANDVKELERQLDDGFPIDYPILQNGTTILIYVCANVNDRAVTEAVIKGNPNVNSRDTTGNTPLHFAARKTSRTSDPQLNQKNDELNLLLVEWLLKQGADKEAITRGRETPLMNAVRGGKIEVLNLLLVSGCPPYQLNGVGQSALKLAKSQENLEKQPELKELIENSISDWINRLGNEEYERLVNVEMEKSRQWCEKYKF